MGLEDLRENLLTANGEVVRIREIESAIARLEQGSIGRDQVDRLIIDRISSAGFLEDPGLQEQISARVEETLEPRFTAAEGDIAGLRGEIAALDASVEPLTVRLGGVDDLLSNHATRLDGLDSQVRRIDRNETRLAAAEAGLTDISAATGRIDGLDRSIEDLGARIEGLDSTVTLASTNATQIGALTNRTVALESATADLGTLRGRVSTLETRTAAIDGMSTRLVNVESQIGDLGTRVEVSEAELASLEGTSARLDEIGNRTSGLEEWRVGADRRIAQLSVGTGGAMERRVSILEERVADHGVSITRLETRRVDPRLIRGGTTPIVGGGGTG